MAIQRIDPEFIDINLVSSIDFQANVTDYVDLLVEFPDETVINCSYWHTDSHSDPITSKMNFYKALNDSTLKIKDNSEGSKKRNVDTKTLVNKNYRDQLPDNHNIKTDSGDKYGSVTTTGEEIEAYTSTTKRTWVSNGELPDDDTQSNGAWEIETTTQDVKHKITPTLDVQKSPVAQVPAMGMNEMGVWFKMWWMEKFNTAHDLIKQDLVELLGDDNEFFVKFSESVGQLKNINDTYDTSTLPLWDTQVNAYGDTYSTPSTVAGVAKYCMQPESLAMSQIMSRDTNKIYRENLCNIMEDPSRDTIIPGAMPSFPGMSHGNNYVNDTQHFSRMSQFVETIRSVIQDHLKGLYDVLEMLSNRENYMVVGKPKQIHMKVENFTVAVDLLKNRIKSYNKDDTEVTNTRYGKRTKFNDSRYSDEVLGS